MRLEDLDYELPDELVAQHPSARREDSRLLVVDRSNDSFTDSTFAEIGRWLRPGDVLALNETRVRPARLFLRRPSGGRVELLFVRPATARDAASGGGQWLVLARPARHCTPGVRLTAPGGRFEVEITEVREGGERHVRVVRGELETTLATEGRLPLPPYIRHEPDATDVERYQSVFARVEGAVAAPTASLHFSESLLHSLADSGVGSAKLLLHVGPGTFRPVTAANPRDHRMDAEWFELDAPSANALSEARTRGGRIVAVGTTVVRALESACDARGGRLEPASGWTRKFIHTPYRFQAVDALVTNFHLPRTTLLLLVAAFAGEERLRRAYAHAVRERYRFYSYGDAMLVV